MGTFTMKYLIALLFLVSAAYALEPPVCCSMTGGGSVCTTSSQCDTMISQNLAVEVSCNNCGDIQMGQPCGQCDPLVCCDNTCKKTSLCQGPACGECSNENEACTCGSTPSPSPAPAPSPDPCGGQCGECESCVNQVCVEDPAKLDPCGKCNSDCKVIAQNIAFSGSLIVGGVDISEKLEQCNCPP